MVLARQAHENRRALEGPRELSSRRALCCLVAALVGLLSQAAHAFERCRDPYTRRCLWQPGRQISYMLHVDRRDPDSHRAFQEAARSALALWTAVPCSDLQLELGGMTELSSSEAMPGQPERNINLISLREGSLEEGEKGNVSIVTYDRITGAILDADIEIVDREQGLSPSDLHNILAHEIGHTLGLEHSSDPGSIMYRFHRSGQAPRELSEDDRNAICSIYPAGLPTTVCEGTPEYEAAGCSAAQLPSSLLWLIAAALALGVRTLLISKKSRVRRLK
ncbi:MAG: matrixin family metalloprotease [Deltaproteobacteria bacterium]|nr:matrixin family metalloprotease [Deltaproteobacteria bacterium]